MGNAPTAWGQVKMTFILYLGGVNYIVAKGYQPISFLF